MTQVALDESMQLQMPPSEVEERTYEYIRADGTVETANSIEDAMRRCPVLGGMAMEQAGMLLELAAIGKAKLAEETETVEQVVQNADTEQADNHFGRLFDESATVEEVLKPSVDMVEQQLNVILEQTDILKTSVMQEQQRIQQIIEAPVITDDSEAQVEVASPMEPHTPRLTDTTAAHDSVAHEPDSLPYTEDEILTIEKIDFQKPEYEPIPIDEAGTENDINIQAGRAENVKDTDTTIEVHQMLRDIIEERVQASPEEQALLRGPEPMTAEEKLGTFMLDVAMSEAVMSPEEVLAHDEDKPLEQTLKELAVCLLAEPKQPGTIEIVTALERFELLLDTLDQVSEKEPLTIELTEALIQFVSELGYEHPGQAITEFVTKHDLEYLLNIIRNLTHILHEEDRQEFLASTKTAFAAIGSDKSSVVRWGRAFLGLLKLRLDDVRITS